MADSNVAASSSSHHGLSECKYDVFLSFSGEDTRLGFASHLHVALLRERINAYMDLSLSRGEEISSGLGEAIKGSKISIVVFSQAYASSKWCLDELVRIMRCKRENEQIVLPIFYGVDPSHVRNQKASYASALVAHEKRFRDDVKQVNEWRSALQEAGSLSGWDSSQYRYDTDFITLIIEDIMDKRIPSNLKVSIYPIGYDSCYEYLNLFLKAGSNDVLMVGIGGTSQMGKTMIAQAVYDGIFQAFDGSSFIRGVGQRSKRPNGLVHLQEKLLSDVLSGESIKTTSVIGGVNDIKVRLRHKKVLIVLDDVTDLDQLFALVGSRKWFGLGSKIIITTRILPLLQIFGVDQIFMAQGLPLPVDIMEIWESYHQSGRQIAGLKGYLENLYYLTNERTKYLEECLIREKRKGKIQEQMICELKHGKEEDVQSNSKVVEADELVITMSSGSSNVGYSNGVVNKSSIV